MVFGAESADFWRSLGVAIVFGLAVSTFLTLVVVPTFYSLLEDWIASGNRAMGQVRGWLASRLGVERTPAG